MIRIVLFPIVLSIAILLLVGTVSFAIHAIAELISRIREEKFNGRGTADGRDMLLEPVHAVNSRADAYSPAAGRTTAVEAGAQAASFAELAEMNRDMVMIVTDDSGCITSCNRGTESLLGYGHDSIEKGFRIESLFDRGELTIVGDILKATKGRDFSGFECLVSECREGGVQEGEWTWIRSDEARIPIALTTSALRNEAGDVKGFLFLARKSLEKEPQEKALMEPTAKRSAKEALAVDDAESRQEGALEEVR